MPQRPFEGRCEIARYQAAHLAGERFFLLPDGQMQHK
jgi:hypothetical protein